MKIKLVNIYLLIFSITAFSQVDLGDDISVCEGQLVTLDFDQGDGFVYSWFFENELIPGENASTLEVSVSGFYQAEATNGMDTITDEIQITFNEIPMVNPSVVLSQCDSDTDGFEIFNLTEAEPLLSDDFANLSFTYFDSSGSIIVDPVNYVNQIASNDIVNVTISSSSVCTVQAQIMLEIITTGLPPDFILSYGACDDDNNGTELFDFSDATSQILSILPSDQTLIITYYESSSEAVSAVNPINPNSYQSNPALTSADGIQDIWVRIEDLFNTCLSIGIPINLNINLLLEPTSPPSIELCDDIESGSNTDGLAIFDLTALNDEITAGNATLNVAYFESESDIDANLPIANPSTYVNIINPQEIFVQVTDPASGCFASTTTTLNVLPNPSPVPPGDVEVCDFDEDGFVFFDLIALTVTVIDGEELDIFYFETEDAALNGDLGQAIDSSAPYTNVTPFFQTIYARVENLNTGCFTILAINLVAIPCPDTDDDGVLDEDEDINNNGVLDDDDTDDDGIPNYLDNDDDGDAVPTINEITGIGAGFIQQDFIDTDDDLIENYLDDDDDGDSILTIDEDYNDSGSPLDDDLNANDIPDFLDADVALSTEENELSNIQIIYNPENEQLLCIGIKENVQLTIYNLNGQSRIQTRKNRLEQVSLKGFSKGIYFITLRNNQGRSSSRKFIKY